MLRLAGTLAVATIAGAAASAQSSNADVARWERQAQRVTIVRDDWGIPHIRGKTDADAVFGMIYAQAEDDFNRVETNYLNALGRLAEAEGEPALYQDLRMRLFVDPEDLKAQYQESPAWLRALMDAWADGLNFYLHTHPAVTPRVIRRFEPWMALSFSEGSIGGDIEQVQLADLEAFYGKEPAPRAASRADFTEREPSGSNGIAIAPSHTTAGKALLLINPHTSFFFRAELQVTSEQGLNAYGAVTWGQFFVYQGFNERAGWMHTSSGVDNIDEYLETIVQKPDGIYYRYGTEERRVDARQVALSYKTPAGQGRREFTVYRTHHGPVVREASGKWVSVRLMQAPREALTQSYTRTKARSYREFRQSLELHTNSSNNTVYADADGTIAYFHANFIPRRAAELDWKKPVDGGDPKTEWGSVLGIDESPLVVNPKNGWLYNTNNWPYTAAGPDSPRRDAFPSYVERGVENPRGLHAIRVLGTRRDWSVDALVAAAYDSYLPAFASLVPVLLEAYDGTPEASPLRARLRGPIESLRAWDLRWSSASVPTTLAVFWGEEFWRRAKANADDENLTVYDYMRDKTSAEQKLEALAAAVDKLVADFGTWQTPWGEVNRFQRTTGDIVQHFDDGAPSIPVAFTSARWGSLASFGARAYEGTKKWYGTSGNSFVAAVEFGPKVRARAVTAGGESGDPKSPHFGDQAQRYSTGDLREVYFYPEQLRGHTRRTYHPGN